MSTLLSLSSFHSAIIADWLPVYGGAEHVIAQLHALFPDAPIFTTVAHRSALGPLRDVDIRTTPLQAWFRLTGRHQWLLPWMPRAIENIDLRGFDLIISSSHAIAKGIMPPDNAKHICYCHTPMRYAWEMEAEYLKDFGVPNILRKKIQNELKSIRRWDLTSAKRVDAFIANSSTTQERIKRIYNRESTVIHPPVEERFFTTPTTYRLPTHTYFLAVGRFVPYKRFDLLIEVANTLKIPLKIAGSGHDERRLRGLAGPTVEFLGHVPDEAMPELYVKAKALLHPQFEDAGVTALEAQAAGTPVIAFRKGGALDTIRDGATGILFAEQTVGSLMEALHQYEHSEFDRAAITHHARQFSSEQFRTNLRMAVAEAMA